MDKFLAGLRDRDVVPTIVSLRRRVEAVGQAELARALARLPETAPETRRSFAALASGIVNIILHPPTARLRAAAQDGCSDEWIAMVCRLFSLAPAEPAAGVALVGPGERGAERLSAGLAPTTTQGDGRPALGLFVPQ